ncbi:hypothetical protein CYY_006892 [Polysphondylium violaceum]|uniref:PARP-type domain-containing protein n=1 Tax=Polysphondylium violaceum TaxID=133409 RepID=A0A8J4PPE2_9MYCE|nr:hypothetical protein CYY_006892 [Polysphondylium violaceum]
MSHNTYKIEYAATARSLCKASKCKKGIEKGELRIGKVYPSDRFEPDGVATDWFHAKCLFESQKKARKTTKKIEDIDDLAGYDDIKPSDQKLIYGLFEEQRKFFLGKPQSKSKPKKKDTSSKASSTWIVKDEDNDDGDDDDNNKSHDKSRDEDEDDEDDILNAPDLMPTKSKQTNSHSSPHKVQHNSNSNNNNNNNNNSTKKPQPKSKQQSLQSLIPKHWSSLEEIIVSQDSYKDFIGETKKSNYLPSNNQIFEALGAIGKPEKCTVVFLGQAPFNKSEWASGFSYCDNSASNWRLNNIRGSTRNLVKAALLDKGYINKQDDIENIQEVLKEIDLPSNSVKEWFVSTAKQGVLWLNMSLTANSQDEGHHERAKHESFWLPVVSEIIRTIFYAKVESTKQDGIVFVLLGKHFSEFKKVIQNLHSDIMGAVPIQIIEGVSPVLETFLNSNYFKSINKDLQDLNSTVIDWWRPKPDDDYEEEEEEEEDEENEVDDHQPSEEVEEKAQVKSKVHSPDINNSNSSKNKLGIHPSESIMPSEASTNVFDINSVLKLKTAAAPIVPSTSASISPPSTPTKSNNSQSLPASSPSPSTPSSKPICDLIMEDGSILQLEEGKEVTLGRNLLPAECKDKAVSRNQAKVTFKKALGIYCVELTPLGQNPMTQTIDNEPTNLQINVPVFLEDGETFYLVSTKYPMKIRFPKGVPGARKDSPSTLSKPPSQSPAKSTPTTTTTTTASSQSSQSSSSSNANKNNKRKNDSDNEEKTPKKPQAPKKKKAPSKKKNDEPYDMDEDYDDSDDDYVPPDDFDNDDFDDSYTIQTRSSDKPMCKYGSGCYRKNPEHLKEFRHPKKK